MKVGLPEICYLWNLKEHFEKELKREDKKGGAKILRKVLKIEKKKQRLLKEIKRVESA